MISRHEVRLAIGKLAICASPILALVACTAAPEDTERLASRFDALSSSEECEIRNSLFVGNRGGQNTFEQFEQIDAEVGTHVGAFVTSGSGALRGPSQAVFDKRGDGNRVFLVANQNTGNPDPGEVLRYDGFNGNFIDKLVPSNDPGAPFAPRGMVLDGQHVLYIADIGAPPTKPGRVTTFDSRTGAFLGDLDLGSFTQNFVPRDLVFGPDGLLYVALIPQDFNDGGGYIVRFDPKGKVPLEVLVDNATCDSCLNIPGGLTFGPDGQLYVLTSRVSETDYDKIQVFEVAQGTASLVDNIPLSKIGEPLQVGISIVFGPGGFAFVTMPAEASVRRYDVHTKTFTPFTPPGSLLLPFYLTFGNTDPGTLAYKPKGPHCPEE